MAYQQNDRRHSERSSHPSDIKEEIDDRPSAMQPFEQFWF